ncbi:medium-chain fatty acid-CoA ligase faa2 [Coemansia sp. Benny D160-2]|nr:medium-chain fatty acid-CoA ligase faa2 [Coemansia sp. Benny D160-2]
MSEPQVLPQTPVVPPTPVVPQTQVPQTPTPHSPVSQGTLPHPLPHLNPHTHGHHHHHHHRNYHPNRGHHHHNNHHHHHHHNHHSSHGHHGSHGHGHGHGHAHSHHGSQGHVNNNSTTGAQSVRAYVVPNSARSGYSSILRHPEHPSGKFSDDYENVLTLYDLFQRALGMFPGTPFLGTRHFSNSKHTFGEFRWKTVREVAETIDDFGSGLDALYEKHVGGGAAGFAQVPLGIYSKNRAEWVVAEFSAFRSRRYTVALYDTADSETVEHIVAHAHIGVLVCSVDKVAALLAHSSAMPSLRVIVSMDALDGSKARNPAAAAFSLGTVRALRRQAAALGVELVDMASVIAAGRTHVTAPRPPSPSDVSTISYTSGTTGRPKGVVSTHANYVYAAKALYRAAALAHSTYLSFFTLAHCFERSIVYTGMLGGMHVGFFSGDVARVFDDAQALRPTVMAGVPHLFNEIYHRMAADTVGGGGWAATLARTAIKQKMQRLEAGKGVRHGLWDRLACNRMAQLFGGRLKLLVSGADPIDAHVLDFLRAAVSCPLLETYGLSESCAAATACMVNGRAQGHVGVPLPGVDVCLRDVPEIGFLTSNQPSPRGELLVRGPNVFMGYYRDEARTHVAVDGEWLATGDLAQLTEDGCIQIVDRRENFVRLPEPIDAVVALEHLETVYSHHPLVHDVFIHCTPGRAELVAVVVPVPDAFLKLAREITGNAAADIEDLANDDQVRSAILIVLYQHGKKALLRPCEMVADVFCETVAFDVEGNGLLTPTYKLRRNVAAKYYRKQIDDMYQRIATQP